MFYFSCFIYVETPTDNTWTVITNMEDLRRLIICLDDRHCNEFILRHELLEQREEIIAMLEQWDAYSKDATSRVRKLYFNIDFNIEQE